MEQYLQDVWELAKTAGPFGLVFTLGSLYYINKERVRLQVERDALLERVLGAIADIADAMGDTAARRRSRQ